MTQDAYKNLTSFELELADHYAETGNAVGLREMQKLSAQRGGESVNEYAYNWPIRYVGEQE